MKIDSLLSAVKSIFVLGAKNALGGPTVVLHEGANSSLLDGLKFEIDFFTLRISYLDSPYICNHINSGIEWEQVGKG